MPLSKARAALAASKNLAAPSHALRTTSQFPAERLPKPCGPPSSAQTALPRAQFVPNSALPKSLRRPVASMSTMPATHGHSEACCNVPPVKAKDYKQLGKYEEIEGMKTYVTGPDDATKAILSVWDIFGFSPQIVQGADILAYSDDHQKYKVFMADWFDGKKAELDWYPPDTDEKKEKLGGFIKGNPPPKAAEKIPGLLKAIGEKYPAIKDWAIIGYCWGGKVVPLVTAANKDLFKAAAMCHPAMVDPKNADGVETPLVLLASQDESADDVKKFEAKLTGKKHVEIFGDQVHGWMAARADLEDAHVKEEYTRGYKTVLTFFQKHI